MDSQEIMRVEIETLDRPFMNFDVLKVFRDYGINIIWMEAYTQIIYIKFHLPSVNIWQEMKGTLLAVEGVKSIGDIGLIAFEQRESLLETMMEHSNFGVMMVQEDGRIQLANKATKIILRTKGEIEGASILDLMPVEDLLKQIRNFGQPVINQTMMYEYNQGICHILFSCRPLKNEAGEVVRLIFTITDMGEVRQMVHSLTRAKNITFDDIVTCSPSMHRLIEMARSVADHDPVVLLQGESGTGKEMFARAIHWSSRRRNQPFVPINCAAIPDTLIESELFGYQEGSFTGAKRSGKQGLFELAHGGTLFLDEIGELSPLVQAKLLRVLQEKRVRRVGGQSEIPVDVRIITATNRDIATMMKTGQFREDLFYRLHVIPLHIPPLREHREDIPLLVEHFCQSIGSKLARPVRVMPDTMGILERYPWPGNVRELSNVLERGAYLAQYNLGVEGDITIGRRHIQFCDGYGEEKPEAWQQQKYEDGESRRPGNSFVTLSLREGVAERERQMIEAALAACSSLRGAARALGVTHTLLLNRIRKLAIPYKGHQ